MNLTTSLNIYIHSPYQKCPILTLPLNTRLLSTQNYSPFLSRTTKGKSLRGHHLVITGRDSIILIITNIIILINQGLWRKRWRMSKTTKASLFASNATNSSVHLTHLIGEIVKTTTKISLYLLKLHHVMASRVTPPLVEIEGAEKGGGTTETAGSSVSTRGRFNQSWTLPHQTKSALMAPIVVKKGESGMGIWKCQRICMIAEGKMSLLQVTV